MPMACESTRDTDRRRRTPRFRAWCPVRVSILDAAEGIQSWGRAVITDLGDGGLRLSMVRLTRGYLPLEPHYEAVLVPDAPDLRDLWMRIRPVHARFTAAGTELGAEILGTAEGFAPDRLSGAGPNLGVKGRNGGGRPLNGILAEFPDRIVEKTRI